MKTAYELAMERLNKTTPPQKKLTAAQKKQLAELDSQYAAKVAEREIFLKGQEVGVNAKFDPLREVFWQHHHPRHVGMIDRDLFDQHVPCGRKLE